MNLPNKLTVLRIIMIPIFVVVYYITAIPYNFIISAVIFALASLTDFLDGYIARKYNMVTDFGKFLDPIADKCLVSTALIVLLVPPQIQITQSALGVDIVSYYAQTAIFPTGSWAFVGAVCVSIILARELIISGFRLVAAGKGKVIAADITGKIKTFFTDVSILFILVAGQFTPDKFDTANIIGLVLLIVSAVLTVVSGIECLIKNKKVIASK